MRFSIRLVISVFLLTSSVSLAGSLRLSPPFSVSPEATEQRDLAGAVLGGSPLVIWIERVPGAGWKLMRSRPEFAEQVQTVVRSDGVMAFPSLASSGDQALLVWFEHRTLWFDLLAVRLDASGESLDDTPLVLARELNPPSYGDRSPVSVAWTGSSYLVVWAERRLFTARITTEGLLLDLEGVAVDSPRGALQTNPSVAAGADRVLLVWQDSFLAHCDNPFPCYGPPPPRPQIMGLLLDRDGRPLEPLAFPVSPDWESGYQPAVAWNGSTFFVAWRAGRATAAYVNADGRVSVPIDFLGGGIGKVHLTNHGRRFVAIWSNDVWQTFQSSVSIRLIEPDGAISLPALLSSEATREAHPFIISNSRQVFAFYQRAAPDMTRLFYRIASDAPRARAVRH